MPIDDNHPIAIVGNLNVDQIITPIDRFPAWDEELIVDEARIELAGTAGYLMLAANGLGLNPYVVSTIGDDMFGDFLQSEVKALGTAASGIEVVPGFATSLGMIFVGREGQRGILTVLGAHAVMDVAVAERHDADVVRCPEVFLCGTYLLPRFSPMAALTYARKLRARGQTVVFDPSWDPCGWSEATLRDTLALLREVDVYLPNEEEICHLTGVPTWQDAIDRVAGTAQEIVVKRGAAGAIYVSESERIEVPALPVRAMNTVGAGDVFDMGFLYARRQRWEPQRALEFACACAAYVVAQTGTRHYPAADEVLAFERQFGAVTREGSACS